MKKTYITLFLFSTTVFNFAQNTGVVNFTDNLQNNVDNYPSGETYILVEDIDENENNLIQDEIIVYVESSTETTPEEVVLTETDVNTGLFFGSITTDEVGTVSTDGILQVKIGDDLIVTYNDLDDDWGSSITISDYAVYGFTEIAGATYIVNTTWSLLESPYLITGDVNVNSGVTLTVEPGVEVNFLPNTDVLNGGFDSNLSELRIHGKIIAKGTQSDSIKFTIHSLNPNPGDWYGIYIDGEADIKYVSISYGEYGIHLGYPDPSLIENSFIIYSNKQAVYLYGYGYTEVNFSNNHIKASGSAGMLIKNVGTSVIIYNNKIESNGTGIAIYWSAPTISKNYIIGGYDGIFISSTLVNKNALITNNVIKDHNRGIYLASDYSQPVINYNNLGGNYDYGIYCFNSEEIDAKDNWWGEVATSEMNAGGNPKDISYIYDQYDDPGKGFVNYSGWLSEPVPHDAYVNVKVFLEGAYSSPQTMNNTISSLSNFPLSQPFNADPWNYDGDEIVSSIPDNVVDWVLLELRDKDDNKIMKYRRAAFVLTNGDVVDLDGTSSVEFQVTDNQYYIAVIHGNHLAVMTLDAVDLSK